MRSSAILCTLCVGNFLFVPISIAEAASCQFTVSPVKRMIPAPVTTYPSSAFIFSAQRFCSGVSPSSMRRMMPTAIAARSLQNFLWSSIRQCSTDHSKKVSIGNPCIDAVFQYGIHDSFIASQFLNSVLGLKEDSSIQEVVFLPRDLPSSDPLASMGYNFTVDVRCKTKDGRHFLVEMQNDFRDDYHLKALIEHSRMLGRMDLDQSTEKDVTLPEKERTRKFWKDIQGIYSIVLTNKVFSKKNQKTTYFGESMMEPGLVNPYELRHVHHLERHYGDVPNQIILLMLANLPKKLAKDLSSVERWAYLFKDDTLRAGARKISETKEIENPEEIAGGDKAIQEFIDRLDMRHLPMDVRRQYLGQIRYHNDCWADIEEKAEARGQARGQEKGKAEGKKEIAINMLAEGISVKSIAACTGLSMVEIQALVSNVGKK